MRTESKNKKNSDYTRLIELKKAVSINPNDADAHYDLGVFYAEMKQYKKAIKSFNQAIFLNPDDPVSYYNLGFIYNELEKYREAIKYLKKSIDLGYDFSDTHYLLGTCYAMVQDFEAAFEEVEFLKNFDQVLARKLLILCYI